MTEQNNSQQGIHFLVAVLLGSEAPTESIPLVSKKRVL